MYPRSSFWGPGISRIIAFFCQGSTVGRDFLEEMSVQGNICQNHSLPLVDDIPGKDHLAAGGCKLLGRQVCRTKLPPK